MGRSVTATCASAPGSGWPGGGQPRSHADSRRGRGSYGRRSVRLPSGIMDTRTVSDAGALQDRLLGRCRAVARNSCPSRQPTSQRCIRSCRIRAPGCVQLIAQVAVVGAVSTPHPCNFVTDTRNTYASLPSQVRVSPESVYETLDSATLLTVCHVTSRLCKSRRRVGRACPRGLPPSG